MNTQRTTVLAKYRDLLRLIKQLPQADQQAALNEARSTTAARRLETNEEIKHQHLKELISKAGYLRITTPKRLEAKVTSERGVYVLRNGELVQIQAEGKGSRVASGTITMEEAQRKNAEHYKRFFGKDKSRNVFF